MASSAAAAPTSEGDALFIDLLHEAPLSGHREPRSVVAGTLYCILLAGFAVVAISAPWIFLFIPDMIPFLPPLLCSANIILLVLTGVFQQYWVHQVKKVRLQGYYDFSQKLKRFAQLPFATIAYGTALMLLIMVWQPLLHILSISLLLRIFIVVEIACAGCFMSLYILHIHKYNSLDGQPDILRSLYSALQPSSTSEDRRLDGRLSDQQMALLQYQRENIHYLSEEGNDMGIKELDNPMMLIAERKRQMEQQESETNMQILLVFLHCLRKQKLEELNEIQTDLQYIKEDISAVERHRLELYRTKERYSMKLHMLLDDPAAPKMWNSPLDKASSFCLPNSRTQLSGSSPGILQNKKLDLKAQVSHQGFQRRDALACSDPPSAPIQSSNVIARKRRVQAQFNELQEYYLQRRRTGAQSHRQEERDIVTMKKEGYHEGLEDFQSVLTMFTRYSRLRVIAELRHGDLFHSANIVSSIEFDRDDELFATAGVSKRIKVFDFSSVVNEPSEVHCPVVEMATRSKLSCLSWNKYSKNVIASSDYEGIVTVWDVQTRQWVMEYEEHEKRAWSVDFSRTEPSMLVSGSDDCKVKVWCTKQESSVINIDMKANICSVKYNPGSSCYVAVGSADHHIHYFDLRNPSTPVHIFGGHKKAVSYVKFLSNNELASASTDSTLRLWDVKDNCPVRTFRGHKNKKNFVGLSVNNEYIACGSETNEVFVYHKAISKPAASHRFVSSDLDDADDDPGSYFMSAVCWKSDSPTMLTANSRGTIKVLVLAP